MKNSNANGNLVAQQEDVLLQEECLHSQPDNEIASVADFVMIVEENSVVSSFSG